MSKKAHILVIRLSAMGDVAMSVPVLRAFCKQYPDCRVTVLSKPFLKALFADIPNVHFFAADVKGKHKGILGLYQLFKELRHLKITHVADFHNVLRSKILRRFFSMTSSKIAYIDKGRKAKKALTREENKIFQQLKTSHQRYADVLSDLGFPVNIGQPDTLSVKEISDEVQNLIGKKDAPWIGIAPFAAFEGKVYPLHLMEKVIEQLSKKYQIILFGGGKKEIAILDLLEKKFPKTKNIAGKLSFDQELNLIAHLNLMLSMDSGNAHLAAMQQVKTVTLWGATHPYAGFAPYNQPQDYCILPDLEKYPKLPSSIYGNKVLNGYEKVMESINPKTVVQKIESILQ